MLSNKREFVANGRVFRTPMLVPSFSSKGFNDNLKDIIRYTSEIITDEILISCYDLYYKKIKEKDLTFPTLIFLDSGGYEAGIETDLSDIQKKPYVPSDWKVSFFNEVIDNWAFKRPTILITYDHPTRRLKVEQQISIGQRLSESFPNASIEILIKPQPKEHHLNTNEIVAHAHELSSFPIIGLTEKELGRSLFERMENIAKIRMALNDAGATPPIHIFGSLDPISTPLYFLSGADIFDGLTWLRFGFVELGAIYKHNFGALNLPLDTPDEVVNGHVWNGNYRFMLELQAQMRQFLLNQDYSSFGMHADFFRRSHERLMESVGVQNGR